MHSRADSCKRVDRRERRRADIGARAVFCNARRVLMRVIEIQWCCVTKFECVHIE
jgi:hypothetical protein